MFTTLGSFVRRRYRLILIGWVVAFAVGAVGGSQAMDRLTAENSGSSRLESTQAQERLDELGGTGGEIVAVVDAPVEDPNTEAAVESAVTEVAGMDGVATVLDPYTTDNPALLATDGEALLVVATVTDDLSDTAEKELAESVAERFRGIEGADVSIGGSLALYEEFQHAAEEDLKRGETIALPIALVAMIVIFGGIVAAGLPLAIAFAGVTVTMVVLLTATALTDVSVFAINIVTMLGIGLGIDYGLLVVSRFREERGHGADVGTAVERTVATAGMTVAFSALTVAVSLLGLFVFAEPTFTSFGIAGIGVVLASMAAGITLLPALLMVAGRRVKPAVPAPVEDGRFYRLARFTQRRAVPTVVIVSIGLALLATPFLGARFEAGDARSLPRGSEVREVAMTLAERFPGRGADPITIVAETDDDALVAGYADQLAGLDGATAVSIRPGTPAGATVIDVVPGGTTQGQVAQDLVGEIRGLEPGFETKTAGTTSFLVDFRSSIGERLPMAIGLIAVTTFVLLFLMTGSIAVPIKAIVMNLLSLGASFGALVWVFQDGNLSGILGFDPVGSVDLFMPILIFIFAFGLSMDYEVFLLSRIKEIHDQTGDNDEAVAVGLQRTGKIITSAALLIVVVFAGFASGDVLTIKQLGFGLALAVIVDATVVRSLLVPATMRLLGEWNWWAPAPLRRLHDRFGIHEAPITPGLADDLDLAA